ncbi:MAG: hypothetical protein SGILL_001908 [Bacillariaceae sp.]
MAALSTILASLNKPPLVLASGLALAGGLSNITVGPAVSLGLLQSANLLAFGINIAAVSVPGRLDGQQDERMRKGDMNPTNSSSNEGTPLQSSDNNNNNNLPEQLRLRSLVLPAGWAFSIWGAIYLGEATFCLAQLLDGSGLPTILPQITPAFVAANLTQSLWCASFRDSYNEGWKKYVSVAMLGGTAYSLSTMLPTVMALDGGVSWYFVPLMMHFGWTTAATLVNLNGSVAMEESVKDRTLVALGHGSAVLATGLGAGLTVFGIAPPAYAFTIAWALLAVGSNTPKKQRESEVLKTASVVQRTLCYIGSALCVAASAFAMV